MRRAPATLAAIVGAIAMIGVALVARGKIDHHQTVAKGPLHLVCVPEVAEACQSLAGDSVNVAIEGPSTTSANLTQSTTDVDAWIVPSPWPTIVDSRRRRAGLAPLFGGPAPVLGRSPIQLVVWNDRAAILTSHCSRSSGAKNGAAAIDGRCVGDASGQPWASIGGSSTWGKVKLGLSDPILTGTGASLLGATVRSYFGRTTLSLADLNNDDAFAVWFERLVASAKGRATIDAPLRRMLSQGPSANDIVATTEAEVASILAKNSTKATLIRTIDVGATVTLLLAGPANHVHEITAKQRQAIVAALRALDWRIDNRAPPDATASSPLSLPATNGLPSDGFLDALVEQWRVTK